MYVCMYVWWQTTNCYAGLCPTQDGDYLIYIDMRIELDSSTWSYVHTEAFYEAMAFMFKVRMYVHACMYVYNYLIVVMCYCMCYVSSGPLVQHRFIERFKWYVCMYA
jgi:hypothetical protein